MDPLHARLDALEQQTQTLARQLRWWRGVAGGLLALAGLTWALPAGTAPEDPTAGGRERLAQHRATLETLRHLLGYVTVATDDEGRPEVVITGANLRLVNGLGRTDCTDAQRRPLPDCPNGLGNLIVGYNETGADGERTGSHNVVVGPGHAFSRVGGLVVGDTNRISGDFAVVSGGQYNTASGDFAVVSGGSHNQASGAHATVRGGSYNTASGFLAAVGGGEENEATGRASAVSGGLNRTAAGEFDWVAGSLVEDE